MALHISICNTFVNMLSCQEFSPGNELSVICHLDLFHPVSTTPLHNPQTLPQNLPYTRLLAFSTWQFHSQPSDEHLDSPSNSTTKSWVDYDWERVGDSISGLSPEIIVNRGRSSCRTMNLLEKSLHNSGKRKRETKTRNKNEKRETKTARGFSRCQCKKRMMGQSNVTL